MIQLKNKIKTALHDSPFVRIICWTIKRISKNLESVFMFIVWCALILMLMALIGLMFNVTIFNLHIPTFLYGLLDIEEGKGNKAKHETLKFIGFGIGVMVTIIAAIFKRPAQVAILNRPTQIETSKEQSEHNRLIEKGHVDNRFKSAIENLGNNEASVRIASFYQFYYLAKDQPDDFRKSVFDILCSYLRAMPRDRSHITKEDKEYPTEECQTLLNVLFKPDDKYVFAKFEVDLRKSYLVRTDLSYVNLSNVNFLNANLSSATFRKANLSRAMLAHTNLSDATLIEANLSAAHLFKTNLSGATLSSANFSGAWLAGTNLSNAKLAHTNLSGAMSAAANLSSAWLVSANFSGSSLAYANLLNTKLTGANFSDADLRGTQLKKENLMEVYSIKNADFREAKIGDRPITKDDIPTDKGEYYADWNPPPTEKGIPTPGWRRT